MVKGLVLCCLLLAASYANSDDPASLDELCKKYECPPMDRFPGSDYETRTVYGAKWVGTDLDDMSDIPGSTVRAFWKLFAYISGSNDQGAKIDMTIPVVNQWFMNEYSQMKQGRMNFYIPQQYQSNTPAPLDPEVTVEMWDKVTTYDRAFGGDNRTAEKYTSEFAALTGSMMADEIIPEGLVVMTAEYTRPGFGKQRSEVVMMAAPKTGDPASLDEICQKIECPSADRYPGKDFEKRTLHSAKWVGVDLENITDINTSAYKAFRKLYAYISGANDKGATIDMTSPVVSKWFMDAEYKVTRGRMHFYIPSKYQADTPLPLDSLVTIETWDEMTTYDLAFGGNDQSEAKYTEMVTKLSEGMTRAGIKPATHLLMTAEYTRPGYGQQRHEVIFLSDNE